MRCNLHDYDIMEEGREQGIAIGEERAKLEAARNMLSKQIGSLEQIADVTDLSLETVQHLADELKVSAVQ